MTAYTPDTHSDGWLNKIRIATKYISANIRMCDYTLTNNKCCQTQETGPGMGGISYKMGMYVPPDVKKKEFTELIKLKKWMLSELKEQ